MSDACLGGSAAGRSALVPGRRGGAGGGTAWGARRRGQGGGWASIQGRCVSAPGDGWRGLAAGLPAVWCQARHTGVPMRSGLHRWPVAGWTGMPAVVAWMRARRAPVIMASQRSQTVPVMAANWAKAAVLSAGQLAGQHVGVGGELVAGFEPFLAADVPGGPHRGEVIAADVDGAELAADVGGVGAASGRGGDQGVQELRAVQAVRIWSAASFSARAAVTVILPQSAFPGDLTQM
jgi:hypothetical protein